MIKNKNKKIAIVGTSPIMLLLYFKLKEKNLVDVYEASDLGGAWRIDKIDGQNYTTHNNVIVALNEEEEQFIDPINKELKNLGCVYTKPTGIYETLPSYNPTNIYIHDFSGLYKNFRKTCNSFIKKKVSNIKFSFNKAYLNGIHYDQIYLPCCFDISEIEINNFKFNNISYKSISHHLTVMYNKINLPNISYTEDFDNVFDRGYFKHEAEKIFFTGRVRRKYKNLQPIDLVKESKLLQKTKSNIIKLKLNKYNHSIIDDKILENLRSKLLYTNVEIIETRQFVHSYKLLNNLQLNQS